MNNEQSKMRWLVYAACLVGMMVGTGCASGKRITASTANDESVKFVYLQQDFFDTRQGIIKCDADEEGELSNCREMDVIFEEEE